MANERKSFLQRALRRLMGRVSSLEEVVRVESDYKHDRIQACVEGEVFDR